MFLSQTDVNYIERHYPSLYGLTHIGWEFQTQFFLEGVESQYSRLTGSPPLTNHLHFISCLTGDFKYLFCRYFHAYFVHPSYSHSLWKRSINISGFSSFLLVIFGISLFVWICSMFWFAALQETYGKTTCILNWINLWDVNLFLWSSDLAHLKKFFSLLYYAFVLPPVIV